VFTPNAAAMPHTLPHIESFEDPELDEEMVADLEGI
jgi:hypothetical protein